MPKQNRKREQTPEEIAQERILKAKRREEKALLLNGLRLQSIPESLRELASHLKELNLSGNDLESLPDWLGELTHLQELFLDGNQLSTVPASLGQLANLQELRLHRNRLIVVPEALGNLGRLEELHLDGNQLRTLPEALGKLRSLKKLLIYDNQLAVLPESLGSLVQLTSLLVYNNQLRNVPSSLKNLSNLRRLYLHENRLTCIPEWIGSLRQLRELSLAKNRFKSVPDTLGHLSTLERLYLNENQLSSVPPSLGQLAQLETLHISGNKLRTLPEALGQLTRLRKLSLDGNKLIELPASLQHLKALTQLFLHANPKLEIASAVLGPTFEEVWSASKDPAAPATILDYYFRTRFKSRPLNELKATLVGRGFAGKSSIVERFIHNTFDEGILETDGIQIVPLDMDCGGSNVRVHFWDFGGQEILHATHQFFLTEGGLYLLVLTGREGTAEIDAEYWLKLIQSFGGDSPVLVVLNKMEEHPFQIDRRALKQKYPAIFAFVETDCKSGKGFVELKQQIAQSVANMPSVQAPFPETWFAIKERLAGMPENFLTLAAYRKECAQLGERDPAAQERLAENLHRLGIVLHFREDERLRDTSVLKPSWVTEGIYKILRAMQRDKMGRAHGELHVSDLAKILPVSTYPSEKRGFLLDLMRRFHLCFALDEEDKRFLVPELLPEQRPDLRKELDGTDCLRLRYRYPEVLPEGLLPRFIVQTNTLSENLPRWRRGVVLEFEQCRAILQADTYDRRVVVSVHGQSLAARLRLLGIIRTQLAAIHADLRPLPVIEEVELEGHPEQWESIEALVKLEKRHQATILHNVPGGDLLTVNVTRQLDKVKPLSARRPQFTPLRLFLSYSHKNDKQRDLFRENLAILKAEGLLETWDDRRLLPGDDWDGVIRSELQDADIIVLLLSTPFLASTYCSDVEVKLALERHNAGKARVVLVIVEKCSWKARGHLSKLQALPDRGKPVVSWRRHREAWHNVETGLRDVISLVQRDRASRP